MSAILNESEQIRARFKTQTPLWTGNLDRESPIVKESGFIGSIRWWTEAILSAQEDICDPTSNNSCPEISNNNLTKYCLSCLIFGATGQRRSFKLQIKGGCTLFNNVIRMKPEGRNGGWFYPGSGMVGKIETRIVPFDSNFSEPLIIFPLLIACKWGAIGAKNQLGYGVLANESHQDLHIKDFCNAIKKIKEKKTIRSFPTHNHKGPNIMDFFFSKIHFRSKSINWWKEVDGIGHEQKYIEYLKKWEEAGIVPIYPSIKNWLRFGGGRRIWMMTDRYNNRRIENFLFGTIKSTCSHCYTIVKKDRRDNRKKWCPNCRSSLFSKDCFQRIASKINISHAYKVDENEWEFRVWGWIPNSNSPLRNRDDFLNKLKGCLDGTSLNPRIVWDDILGSGIEDPRLIVWREFNSSRDTKDPNQGDYNTYIDSLIDGE